jgi:DMSO reductase family type II enzyme chaperone
VSAVTTAAIRPALSEIERALARAAIYRLLGRAFGYPTRPTLAELADLAARAATAAAWEAAIVEPLARFAAAARDADPDAVASEHVLLFCRQVQCPPYESAYGEAPRMAGKPAALADIAGFYRAFGLAPAETQPDLEDHVSTELEFMSVLALKEAYALAEGHADGLAVTREAGARFVADHLGRWAEAFAREVQSASPLAYYTAAAELLAAWIGSETGHLDVAPARVTTRMAEDPLGADTLSCPVAEGGSGRGADNPGG